MTTTMTTPRLIWKGSREDHCDACQRLVGEAALTWVPVIHQTGARPGTVYARFCADCKHEADASPPAEAIPFAPDVVVEFEMGRVAILRLDESPHDGGSYWLVANEGDAPGFVPIGSDAFADAVNHAPGLTRADKLEALAFECVAVADENDAWLAFEIWGDEGPKTPDRPQSHPLAALALIVWMREQGWLG